jgi:hypothetical protein
MADVHFMRKDDAEADRRVKQAVEALEAVIESVKEGRCNGMLLVAYERVAESSTVEMDAQRYYLSSGVGDMLTLMGMVKCVTDEMSEGLRLAMDVS